jgi:hypothetical protein
LIRTWRETLKNILSGTSSRDMGLDKASTGLSAALRVVESSGRPVPAQALDLYRESSAAAKLALAKWNDFKSKRVPDAKSDKAHIEKFEKVYRSRLIGRFEESFCCAERFLEHYQIARNVWHLNEAAGDIAVFLFPKANTRLRQEEPLIKACALEPFRSRIRIVYLEDIVVDPLKTLKSDEMVRRQQLEEFRAKYLSFI